MKRVFAKMGDYWGSDDKSSEMGYGRDHVLSWREGQKLRRKLHMALEGGDLADLYCPRDSSLPNIRSGGKR